MSEARQRCFWEPTFNRAVKVRAHDERLTSDGGMLLMREADHRLGVTAAVARQMTDPRDPDKTRYTLLELLRERVYALGAGYRAQDDLDRLAHDPALRVAAWHRPGAQVLDERLASQPTQSRLLDALTFLSGNREALRRGLSLAVLRHQRARADRAVRRGTLDIDGFPLVVHGKQAGAAYNGHYDRTMYYPLVASFAPEGDYDHARLADGFVHALLRKGNAWGAEGSVRFILKAVEQAQSLACTLDVRFDAAFAVGRVMDPLADHAVRFVGRLPGNSVLDRMAEPCIFRPEGRPPKEGYEWVFELGRYRAKGWRHPQRVVLVVVDKPKPDGYLDFGPEHFFLVTNYAERELDGWDVLEHYRKRGTFEDRIGEFQAAIGPRLPSETFAQNETTLLLSLLAFNLLNVLRSELEGEDRGLLPGWDLGRLQTTVLKAGARVAKGSRQLFFYVAAPALPLWEALIARLRRWRLPVRWRQPTQPQPRPWIPAPAHAHDCAVLRL